MTTHRMGRAAGTLLSLLCFTSLLLLLPVQARGDVAGMRNYCNVPPLPGTGVKPNLLLFIDNSASMYDLAYTDPSKYCLDDSADTFEKPGTEFPGYFDPKTIYSYNFNGSGSFSAAFPQGIPSSEQCNAARTPYLCVNSSSGTVNRFVASGKFLNWLSMSKLDIEKGVLTGGKYQATGNLLQAESRGCQGKRFIKMVGNAPVTFAVRGPLPSESGYQTGGGGATRIEIYTKRYRKEACLGAVTAWQGGTPNEFRRAALDCVETQWDDIFGAGTGEQIDLRSAEAVHAGIMSLCHTYRAGGTLFAGDEVTGSTTVDVKPVADFCIARNMFIYGGQPPLLPAEDLAAICGDGLYGTCFALAAGFQQESCLIDATVSYCAPVSNPSPIDPSAIVNRGATSKNVPGFLLDIGLANLGAVSGTLLVEIAPASEPRGLLQEYGDRINFGAMRFNVSGNGGEIISYINDAASPLGDHTGGLIAAVDGIPGNAWTPLSAAFYEAIGYFGNRSALRLQDGDFLDGKWPSRFTCQSNNILLMTDGVSTMDRAQAVNDYVATAWTNWGGAGGMPASQRTAGNEANPKNQGSYNLDDLAWIARNRNIINPQERIGHPKDYLSTYVVYTGVPCSTRDTAGKCTTSDEGVPEKIMQLAAEKGGGGFARAQGYKELEGALRKMFEQIGTGTNSGTNASMLTTGDANAAVFLQEHYYPNRSFDGGATSASWIGEMQGLWYYIDPFIQSTGAASTVRDDANDRFFLDLKSDRAVLFSFDESLQDIRANLYKDGNGDGDIDPVQPYGYPQTLAPDQLQALWRAGLNLWNRDPATRTIYTQTNGRNLVPFLDTTIEANWQLLQANNKNSTDEIVSWVKGTDTAEPGNRSRKIKADGAGQMKEWKLGDIISSTPALQTGANLGNYHLLPPRGYADTSYSQFLKSDAYKDRGTVYVGANDGMLHAFNLGTLRFQRRVEPLPAEEAWPATRKAALDATEPGKEQWAFIPRNALPYLRYLKEPAYPHLYYVDGSSILADVSIGKPEGCSGDYWNCLKDFEGGSTWRTVLIGGMGLGGAAKGAADICVEGTLCSCVRAPPGSAGLSSYFALDVTNQKVERTIPEGEEADTEVESPKLLWEFSHSELGFATSGAAIVKINGQKPAVPPNPPEDDPARNGRWFAVFASGPTGSIDSGSCQFLGTSSQHLKLFVVDINAAPPLVERTNFWVIDTDIPNAFGGSMTGAAIDINRRFPTVPGHYEDDALYFGYTELKEGKWTGGVVRLQTKGNNNPLEWGVSKVIEGIGPVTGSVAKLQDRRHHKLWLYFGTGRYFFNQDNTSDSRALFAVNDPCYMLANPADLGQGYKLSLERSCLDTPLKLSDDLTEVTVPLETLLASPEEEAKLPANSNGWWIGLDAAAGGWGSERVTADPSALPSGLVLFPTFKPSTDPCQQAVSYLWQVKYDTGGSLKTDPKGKALVALSNGNSSDLALAGWEDKDGRRSPPMPGRTAGVRLITNSGQRPLKRIIHIQER